MLALNLEGTERKEIGTKYAKGLRRNNLVPCVIYGGQENKSFQAPYAAFDKLVYNSEFFTVKVNIDGTEFNTIIKDIQFHPTTDKILHIDFLELTPKKKVVTEIPVKLTGFAQGVRDGGVLLQRVRKLKVKMLPKDLVEHIEVNIDELGVGKSIKVEELILENMEVLTPGGIPVARVAIPRALVVEDAEGEETAEGTETAEGGETPAEGEKSAEGGGEDKPAEGGGE